MGFFSELISKLTSLLICEIYPTTNSHSEHETVRLTDSRYTSKRKNALIPWNGMDTTVETYIMVYTKNEGVYKLAVGSDWFEIFASGPACLYRCRLRFSSLGH